MLLHARTLFLCLLLTLFGGFAAAQEKPSPKPENKADYEILMQLMVSTDSTANTALPAALAPLEKKLKADFGNAKYQLAMTLFNRAAENGLIQVKGVSSLNQNESLTAAKFPNFVDFQLTGIASADAETVKFGYLNFALRLPVVQAIAQEGKSVSAVSYESVGITAKPLTLTLDKPTIIGTLTTSRPNELMVLIVTVKSDSANANPLAKKN